MNLLRDPWVQVFQNGRPARATVREILCGPSDFSIAARRDDTELATIQLLAAIAQCLHTPSDNAALRRLVAAPLASDVYDEASRLRADWFELNHAEKPFMQSRGVEAKEVTPVQKLFPGLPEGNNHAFFNDAGEIGTACAPCVAVALFHQASNCPSFGGGFKGSLRGGSPITTLVAGSTLRETVWRNVLTENHLAKLSVDARTVDLPTWVNPIVRGATLVAGSIGIVRGLFWQPARIEIVWEEGSRRCDACGLVSDLVSSGFRKEKFSYTLDGLWSHPHGPRVVKLEGSKLTEYYRSFTTEAPPWTHLAGLVAEQDPGKSRPGSVPAPVVSQALDADSGVDTMALLVGGYRNNQASIIERRHEVFRLQAGWNEHVADIERIVELALDVRQALRTAVKRFGDGVGVASLAGLASNTFYADSEPQIRETFRRLEWSQVATTKASLFVGLRRLSRRIFEDLTAPYEGNPKALVIRAVCRKTLEQRLHQIGEPYRTAEKEVA